MDLAAPSLEALTTVVGAGALTLMIVEAIKRATAVDHRWLPWISMGIGIGTVLIASWALGLTGRVDIVQGVVTGIVAGLGASGTYDAAKSLSGDI